MIGLSVWGRVGFLAAFAVLAASGKAWAEEDFRPAFREAILAKERAQDSGLASDWSEALRRLRLANELRETAEVSYEIAVAATNLGYEDLAVDAYQHSLELGLAGPAAVKAHAYVAEREADLAALTVVGRPACRVHINDLERAILPLSRPILTRAGACFVELWCDGAPVRAKQVAVSAGERLQLDFDDTTHDVAAVQVPPTLQASESRARSPSTQPRQVTQQSKIVHPQSALAHATRWRTVSYSLLGAGAALGAASAILIPVSYSKVASWRQSLHDYCDVNNDGVDGCTHAKAGAQAEAQAASDAVASWKAVRTVAWVGLAAGLTAAVSGAALLLASPSAGKLENPGLWVSVTHQQLGLSWHGSF